MDEPAHRRTRDEPSPSAGVTSYLTIARDATAEVEVPRSRFLCTLRRVATEDAARALVAALRREHWDARHHCSAFVLGPDAVRPALQSDDGEPAGTAGAPMLEVLRGAGVSDVAAVVTRWFGGTLLGAGGLVRAYGDAVRAARGRGRDPAPRRCSPSWPWTLDHADAGRVEGELRARGVARARRGVRRRACGCCSPPRRRGWSGSTSWWPQPRAGGPGDPGGERWVDVTD